MASLTIHFRHIVLLRRLLRQAHQPGLLSRLWKCLLRHERRSTATYSRVWVQRRLHSNLRRSQRQLQCLVRTNNSTWSCWLSVNLIATANANTAKISSASKINVYPTTMSSTASIEIPGRWDGRHTTTRNSTVASSRKVFNTDWERSSLALKLSPWVACQTDWNHCQKSLTPSHTGQGLFQKFAIRDGAGECSRLMKVF